MMLAGKDLGWINMNNKYKIIQCGNTRSVILLYRRIVNKVVATLAMTPHPNDNFFVRTVLHFSPLVEIRNFYFWSSSQENILLAHAQNELTQNFCGKNYEIMTKTKKYSFGALTLFIYTVGLRFILADPDQWETVFSIVLSANQFFLDPHWSEF